MIQYQFAISGKIDIRLWLQAFGFSTRYINDHIDKYHYFIHVITEKKVFNKAIGPDGFVSLNMKGFIDDNGTPVQGLRSFLGNPYADEVRNNLLAMGIIQCDGSYVKRKYSLGYRIHPAYQGKTVLQEVFKTETMVPKLAKLSKQYQDKTGKDQQKKNLKMVGIRYEEALQYVDKKVESTYDFLLSHEGILSSFDKESGIDKVWYDDMFLSSSLIPQMYSLMVPELLKNGFQSKDNEGLTAYDLLINYVTEQHNRDFVAITKIQNQNYFYKQPDVTSRIFTNVTNLSTDLRDFLVYRKGKGQLVNLDIRNSQPYLLSLLLMDKYKSKVVPADVQRYINLCADGDFYEYMMIHMKVPRYNRKAFKIKFFASLFFCTNHYAARTTSGKFFAKHFPNVYELIKEEKAEDYRQLAIKMQKREASVILGVIGKKLSKLGVWFVTIHDSVVVTQNNAEAVKNLISEAFEAAVGIAPTIEEDVLVETKKQQSGNSEMEEEEAEILGSLYNLEGWEEDKEEKRKEIETVNQMVKTLVEENTTPTIIITSAPAEVKEPKTWEELRDRYMQEEELAQATSTTVMLEAELPW